MASLLKIDAIFAFGVIMRATDNLKLGVTCFGNQNATPLVITPGWATDYNFLLPFAKLFPEYCVMLVDLPGYGKSRHLAKYASSIRQTSNLLLNTLPHDCILISWSLQMSESHLKSSCKVPVPVMESSPL